jgi:pimeloyl-ACP methyl ester carboxylesterase
MDVTGGARLAVREAGAGAPVVLLHGLFGHAGNFGAIARRLGERHRVLALDLRNHGGSPHATPMSYPAMAADVLATMDALGLAQAALVGHSMGGKVAMLVAQGAPARVARLCVVDIAPRAYPAAFDVYARAMAAIPLRAGLTRGEADAAMAHTVPQPAVRAFLLQNLRLDTAPPAWRLNLPVVAAALPEISAWVPPEVPAYRGPTLFLAGARSDYIAASDTAAIIARFPQARIETVPGAGHWVHAEAGEAFLAVLAPFLGG